MEALPLESHSPQEHESAIDSGLPLSEVTSAVSDGVTGSEADLNHMEHTMPSSPIPLSRYGAATTAVSNHFVETSATIGGEATGSPVVLSAIEDIFTSFARDLAAGASSVSILLRTRILNQADATSGSLLPSAHVTMSRVSFPGRTVQEARQFTVLVRVLQLIHEALTKNVKVTKRDIYYKDAALFQTQTTVDRYVDRLAFTFGVQRHSLNVVASTNGVVVGRFAIVSPDWSVLDGQSEPKGMLVPPSCDAILVDISGAAWILIVEKEATFQSLAGSKFCRNRRIGNGIILTVKPPDTWRQIMADQSKAKGYPDLSTRAFIRCLSISHNAATTPPPIFALVDYDPDGIAIMSTYKHGSFNLAHESEALKVPRIQWLGLKSSDLQRSNYADDEPGLLRLTERDRRLAMKMLQKPLFAEGMEVEWRKELQTMIMLNKKAEIQLLGGRPGGLEAWLEDKIMAMSGTAAPS